MLLPENISVFAFDFSGAGLSDGEYLSLGYYEKADVSTVVDYLKARHTIPSVLRFEKHPCNSSLFAFLSFFFICPSRIKCVRPLQASGCVSTIALWGHSMGAATSLLYASGGGETLIRRHGHTSSPPPFNRLPAK